jgi:hypothetical protein
LTTDARHCGRCGNSCDLGEACCAGRCVAPSEQPLVCRDRCGAGEVLCRFTSSDGPVAAVGHSCVGRDTPCHAELGAPCRPNLDTCEVGTCMERDNVCHAGCACSGPCTGPTPAPCADDLAKYSCFNEGSTSYRCGWGRAPCSRDTDCCINYYCEIEAGKVVGECTYEPERGQHPVCEKPS